jgi:hypothetical protein
MTLAPCRECGQQVSAEATTCPLCGVPAPVQTIPATEREIGFSAALGGDGSGRSAVRNRWSARCLATSL